jgi:hypothetical protein
MDRPETTSPFPKAQRLRRVTFIRARETWVFVCAPGEEAQLVREAAEALEAAGVPRRRLHLAVLARQLGVLPAPLNPGVRKAD